MCEVTMTRRQFYSPLPEKEPTLPFEWEASLARGFIWTFRSVEMSVPAAAMIPVSDSSASNVVTTLTELSLVVGRF